MRNLLILALALGFATEAHASKARVDSLLGARFLKDTQTIFVNPAHVNSLGQFFTAEFGGTGNTSNPKAEGGLLVNKFGGKFGMYVGHMNPMQAILRTGEAYPQEQNPVEAFYGNSVWGASVYYSRNNKETTKEYQRTMGLRVGYDANNLEVYASTDVLATSEKSATQDFKRKFPTITAGAEYAMGDLYFFGEAAWLKSKQDVAAFGTAPNNVPASNDANVDSRIFEVGAQDRSLSAAGRTFYYGASLRHSTFDKVGKKTVSYSLPVVAGIEYELVEWATLRASLAQNFVLGNTKDETLAVPNNDRKDGIANNTTASAGAGLKWKGFVLDGLFAAASTGNFNGSSFLTRAALTYNF